MRHQVFLSYASEDAKSAERVCVSIEAAGTRCWIAPRDIPAGTSYAGEIVRAIDASRLLVLLYSRHAAESRHVRSELERAFNNNAPILPVRLDGHEIPTELQYFLSTAQWIDAFDSDFETELAGIAKSVRALLEGAPVPFPTGDRRRQPALKWAAAAVLLLAVVGAVIFSWPRDNANRFEPPPVESVDSLPDGAGKGALKDQPQLPEQRVNSIDGLTYLLIPAGRYFMGCSTADSECEDDEKPAHWVTITKPFWLGQTEVTIGAFRGYARNMGARAPVGDDRLPITQMDRLEAKAFCLWAGGRLPTEAEWEYAARGGLPEPRYGSLREIAWFDENSDEQTHPVAAKQPNSYGLYDMLGNVAEWVFDRYYNRYYEEEPGVVPDEPLAPNASGIVRGGSWAHDARSARASNRAEMYPDDAEAIVGFRCAADQLQ